MAHECPCLAVLPRGHLTGWPCWKSATHPSPGDTSPILLTHRDTRLAEPRAGGAKTHQGLHPRQPGKMLALDLLSHPATLGGLGSSGKPPHDGTKANSDKGTSCGTAPALWHTAGQDAAPASCSDPTHPSGSRASTQHLNPSFLTAETQQGHEIPSPLVHGGEVTGTSVDPLLGHGEGENLSPVPLGKARGSSKVRWSQISWQCTDRAEEMPGSSRLPSKQQNSSGKETGRPRAAGKINPAINL